MQFQMLVLNNAGCMGVQTTAARTSGVWELLHGKNDSVPRLCLSSILE
jgi:hypothetical protein